MRLKHDGFTTKLFLSNRMFGSCVGVTSNCAQPCHVLGIINIMSIDAGPCPLLLRGSPNNVPRNSYSRTFVVQVVAG